ncbi:MAG: hypothetical protein JWM99_4334 [Verrucomicrobiales bacterium]|nr:hypothetical protein [Verrucomicrobiales bacterium]
MNDENKLLRRYVEECSEVAFGELVRRYLDVVYAAALRQVNGDSHLAQEVTQSVFLDLARKSHTLLNHPSLLGWLYTSTRFTAISMCRTEQRRRAREQKAEVMVEQDSESAWQQLWPVLDKAMHTLNEKDREAVLLRFFEGLTLSQMGRRWGITENTARMRVERAVEKLRRVLIKKGSVTASLTLVTILTTRAVAGAPPDLASRIEAELIGFKSALPQPSTSTPPLRFRIKIALLLGFMFVAPCLWWLPARLGFVELRTVSEQKRTVYNNPAAQTMDRSGLNGNNTSPGHSVSEPKKTSLTVVNPLEIHVIAADSGEPIPNTTFNLATFVDEKWNRQNITSSRHGVARIGYPEGISQLEMYSRVDGFADTHLEWRIDRGEKIPPTYVLRLTRAITVGGAVVDEGGSPVAGAKVVFSHRRDLDVGQSKESHKYLPIETETDSAGRWSVNRIAPEMLPLSTGIAKHPKHSDSLSVDLTKEPQQIPRLTNGTYTFRVNKTVEVNGVVLDELNEPIKGARVASSMLGDSADIETTTTNDGGFVLNIPPGPRYLSVQADGYAPTSMGVVISDAASPPFELRLVRGKTIRFLVIDPDGNPIQGARLELARWNIELTESNEVAPGTVQAEAVLITDEAGRTAWTNAPAALLKFNPTAKGYLGGQTIRVRPSDKENVITLEHALRVSGIVKDFQGKPLERYRILVGGGEQIFRSHKTVPRWSPSDRFRLRFSHPNYDFTIEEPVQIDSGPIQQGYFFKFEAEGFIPVTTRFVAPDERDVTFDIKLQPANGRVLQIFDSQGLPVANAPTLFLPDGAFVYGSRSGLDPVQEWIHLSKTDSNGTIPFEIDPEFTSLVVACSAGSISLARSEIPSDGIITLQPWGRIDGRISRNGQPSNGESLTCLRRENLGDFMQSELSLPPLMFSPGHANSDAEGRFTFADVPPGYATIIVAPRANLFNSSTPSVHQGKTEVFISDEIPISASIDIQDAVANLTPK